MRGWMQCQPGRAKCQHDGAKRALTVSLHQELHEGGRPQREQHHDRRVPRHGHGARRSHRSRCTEGSHEGPGHSHGGHKLQVELRAHGGVRGGWRHSEVHPDDGGQQRHAELAPQVHQPAHRVCWLPRALRERVDGHPSAHWDLRGVLVRRRGHQRTGRPLEPQHDRLPLHRGGRHAPRAAAEGRAVRAPQAGAYAGTARRGPHLHRRVLERLVGDG
mmetsp:Transcript_2391/g.7384  ORF Transcript_2391/g.7384 Transcript_2391/m.7384 type:complete len:217 (-) Transcript_2391:1230-1880(-)